MPSTQQATPPEPASTPEAQPAQPVRRPWTVQFVVPAPEAMPSERLKARAELVRRAQSCTNCYGY